MDPSSDATFPSTFPTFGIAISGSHQHTSLTMNLDGGLGNLVPPTGKVHKLCNCAAQKPEGSTAVNTVYVV